MNECSRIFAVTAVLGAVVMHTSIALGAIVANADFENGEEAWRMKPAYSVKRGAGMNGTSALVYENADPNLPYSFPSQKIELKKGEIYRFSAWIRTENLVPASGGGAMLAIECSDGEGRHLGGSYSKSIRGTHDWTRIEGVTTAIPDRAANMSFVPYCTPGSVGKAYFDDIEVVPYEKPAVGHMLSSFYRNTAESGVAEFRVVLSVPEKYAPADLKAEFSYATPDGSRKTMKAATDTLYIPYYPFYYLMAIGLTLFAIELIFGAVRNTVGLFNRDLRERIISEWPM